MKLSLILFLSLFLSQVFSTDISTNVTADDNRTESDGQIERHREEKQNGIEGSLDRNVTQSGGPFRFVQSAINRAKWNVLYARMSKVIISFFLDLFIAQFFGLSGGTVSRSTADFLPF